MGTLTPCPAQCQIPPSDPSSLPAHCSRLIPPVLIASATPTLRPHWLLGAFAPRPPRSAPRVSWRGRLGVGLSGRAGGDRSPKPLLVGAETLPGYQQRLLEIFSEHQYHGPGYSVQHKESEKGEEGAVRAQGESNGQGEQEGKEGQEGEQWHASGITRENENDDRQDSWHGHTHVWGHSGYGAKHMHGHLQWDGEAEVVEGPKEEPSGWDKSQGRPRREQQESQGPAQHQKHLQQHHSQDVMDPHHSLSHTHSQTHSHAQHHVAPEAHGSSHERHSHTHTHSHSDASANESQSHSNGHGDEHSPHLHLHQHQHQHSNPLPVEGAEQSLNEEQGHALSPSHQPHQDTLQHDAESEHNFYPHSHPSPPSIFGARELHSHAAAGSSHTQAGVEQQGQKHAAAVRGAAGAAQEAGAAETPRPRPQGALISVQGAWRARNPPLGPGAGRGKVLFVDAQTSGIAGDMLVAALLDLGVPLEPLYSGLHSLALPPAFFCTVLATQRSAIVAPRFLVQETSAQPYRDYAAIVELLEASTLPRGARRVALSAFRLLAQAEAIVHGVPLESVHFHEVGAIDSIVDIVASSLALDYLGCPTVLASPLPMGRGIIRGAAHGPLPCPAPATLDILCRCGIPTVDAGMEGELVTPTGACMLGSLASGVCTWPAIVPERAAYGAGTKSWSDRPNLLRLVLGASFSFTQAIPSRPMH